MAREKGSLVMSDNIELAVAAPLDARSLVEARSDLIKTETWQTSKGEIWLYDGLLVSVARDTEPINNGVYRLENSKNYQDLSAWIKLSDSTDLKQVENELDLLKEQINDINSAGTIEVDFESDLPEIGAENITYYIKDTVSIQRWDSDAQKYISYGGTDLEEEINLIYGGNANGTN